MNIRLCLRSAVVTAFLLLALPTQAAIIVTAIESDGNVIFSTDGGTLDLTGLRFDINDTIVAGIAPTGGSVVFGGAVDRYTGVTFTSFGPGTGSIETADSDPLAGFGFGREQLAVPTGFLSGDTINATSITFTGETFASLGITAGNYTVASWAGDSITLNATAVPVPAAVWLFGSALGMLGWMRRKRA